MLLLIALLTTVYVVSPDPMPDYLEGYSCDRFVREIQRSASGGGNGGTDVGADKLRWALARCPEDERVWYLLARYSEADAIRERDRQFPDAQTAIEAAFKKFPTSRIAAVRARVAGTIEAAQTAVQINPSYRPARIALAGAMLRAGQTSDALHILEPMAKDFADAKVGLQHSFTGWLTLARARLAADDPRGAEQAYRRAGKPDLDDTYSSLVPRTRRYESLLIDGLVALGLEEYPRAARQLLVAAARGSREAIAELKQASPPLRRQVAAIADPFEGAIELSRGVSEPAGLRKRERELGPIALGIAAWVARDYREGASYLLKGLTGTPEEQGHIISLIREHDELACALREEVSSHTLRPTLEENGRRVLEEKMCPDYTPWNVDSWAKHPCDNLVRDIELSASGHGGERGREGGLHDLRSALDRCPEDERVWYLLARFSEADAIPEQYKRFPDAMTAIDAAYEKFPTSRIATVRARMLGTIKAAQAALQIDPTYRPARIALARAFLRAGRTGQALEILEPMAKDFDDEKVGLQYSLTGWMTLVRARLTAGDPRGAARAMRLTGSSELDDDYDLFPRWRRYEWWTVDGLVASALKDYPRAAHQLLLAAARGSLEALAELQRPSPQLRKQVAIIVHNPPMVAKERDPEIRSVALGIGAWLLQDYDGAVQHLLVGLRGGRHDREYVTSLIVDHDELASALRACLATKRVPPAIMEDARTVLSGHAFDERGDD